MSEAEDISASVEGTTESIARSLSMSAPKDGASRADELIEHQIRFLDRQGKLHHVHHRLMFLRLLSSIGFTLGGILILAVVLKMLISAVLANNVVIDVFDVPPALIEQGQSGKVIASDLQDELQRLQIATHDGMEKQDVVDAWSGDVKLEIPETGVSLGEINRYMREWLGHETHIDGDVTENDDGTIAVTVRGHGFLAKTFTGKPAEIPKLVTQAAEYLYSQAEPYQFEDYLFIENRFDDLIQTIQTSYATESEKNRAGLLDMWGVALLNKGEYAQGAEKLRRAVQMQPDDWGINENLQQAYISLHQEENAVQNALSMEQRARRGHWFAKNVGPNQWENADQLTWDLPALQRDFEDDIKKTDGVGGNTEPAALPLASVKTLMHDDREIEILLQTGKGIQQNPMSIAGAALARGIGALDLGDIGKAQLQLRQANTIARSSPAILPSLVADPACWGGLAEGLAGDAARSAADFAQGGTQVDCYRFKADVMDHNGDWAGAQKQYASAVALAPSISSSYYSWGMALLRHGDADGSIAKFKDANQRSPHWADPLKGWGDALAAKQDYRGAVEQYEQAEAFASNWGALHLAWGRALDKLGEHDKANEQYQKARELDLSDADRKSLGT
jgi:tetratricopeptide (TPR) repeat protein